jgi:hypothetical protein
MATIALSGLQIACAIGRPDKRSAIRQNGLVAEVLELERLAEIAATHQRHDGL